jgi:hypothetical protein
LTSDAFTLQKEKDEVPSWRDGAAGENVQWKMIAAAETRYVNYNFFETGAPPLSSPMVPTSRADNRSSAFG